MLITLISLTALTGFVPSLKSELLARTNGFILGTAIFKLYPVLK